MGTSWLPRSLRIQGRSYTITHLRGQNSCSQERDTSMSLAAARSLLGFIQVGDGCLLSNTLPGVWPLCKYCKSCFSAGFVFCLELCSARGHILHHHHQPWSLSSSRRYKQGNIVLALSALLEFIFILHSVLPVFISVYETLFSLPF